MENSNDYLTIFVKKDLLYFSAMSGQERDELEREKRGSLLQLMFRSARILNDIAIEQVRRTMGLEGLRPAHTALFPHIDLDGTRLTELARRLGISKQAVGQLVDELEAMGGLERVPDPVDGRAKLVRFRRRKGRLVLFEGLEVLGKLETALEQEVGPAVVEQLREGLLRIEPIVEQWRRDADCVPIEPKDEIRTEATTEAGSTPES